MTPSLLQPQGRLSPAETLELAQQAPEILRRNPKAISSSPLQILFSAPETADLWTIYENLLLSCLRAGDDTAAHQVLERLVLRFGEKDERLMALNGLVKEAEATNDGELQKILEEYDALLEENDTNMPIYKRKIALLRSLGKAPQAITALNAFLDFSPTDSEAWAELADLYLSQGLYPQAIHALEEVLVLVPNAWNIHARLGEVSLMAANTTSEGFPQKHLAEALKRFCRSIELCDDYLRGYYGLKLTTDKLLSGAAKEKRRESEGFSLPEQATIEKLNQAATDKLGEIVRRHGAQERLWQGYDAGEVAAARELLAKTAPEVIREGEHSHEQDYSVTDSITDDDDDDDWEDDYEEVHPSDSASTSNDYHPSRPRATRAATRRHRVAQQQHHYAQVQAPAPNPPSVAPSEEYGGQYGPGYQPQPAHRGNFYGSRGGHGQHPYQQNHYMGGYPGGNQVIPYGGYPNPFSPMSTSSSGASYFGGEPPRHMYDVMPYQHGYYGPPAQYNLPAHMQQFHLSQPPPPPATEAPAPAVTPAPKEPPVDIEKIKMEAKIAAMQAHEEKQRALNEQRERDAQIRKEAEEAFLKKMDEMKKQQEEAQKEIARARAEAERAAVERVEAERRAADERRKQEAEAMKRAEENALKKVEAEMKAAEERRKREAEERVRIEEAAKARLEAAMKAEAEAKAAAEKKAAEEAERLKLIQEDAKRKAEADAAAKVAAEKEAAVKAAEAEETAKKEHEALKKRIQEEAKAKFEEAAKKTTDKPPSNSRMPWDANSDQFMRQGMEELIKQAFLHVDVIGPHVQQGHYDLIGPNGEIILPSVWERVVQPDWSIKMTMWPVESRPQPGLKFPHGMMPGPAGGRRGHIGGGAVPPPPPIPGVGPAGRRPGVGVPPAPGWPPAGGRRGEPDIINVGPPPKGSKSSSKRNSAMLTFFAGKPTKKK
ncbi:kinetoplast-associated protein KAP [Purpureocillium lavendulum]|uniref:Kinetoplast-associated protein KAP n=1 Tax=Purpureocillium lavendulum TaxID=1247861 RepID=A0AB34FID3_9HYPO|nr:kinetoplast-associated protein KAP [Purpureocillium lavendulum]